MCSYSPLLNNSLVWIEMKILKSWHCWETKGHLSQRQLFSSSSRFPWHHPMYLSLKNTKPYKLSFFLFTLAMGLGCWGGFPQKHTLRQGFEYKWDKFSGDTVRDWRGRTEKPTQGLSAEGRLPALGDGVRHTSELSHLRARSWIINNLTSCVIGWGLVKKC